jgi:hypothetical protein
MSERRLLPKVALCLVGGIVLALVVRWLGRVDYDTQPSAEEPSRPTAPIFNEADQAVDEGGRWAARNEVNSHQTCRTSLGSGFKALGCHRYVTVHKNIPPLSNWRAQPTTRDCVAGVRAHYDLLFQDMIERGEYHAVSVAQRNSMEPALGDCNNIDNMRIIQAVHEPLARIEAMLANLRAGQPLSEEEQDQLRHDFPLVEVFREDRLRSRYLALADELFALVGGHERVFPLALPGKARVEQCAALAQQVVSHKAAFHEAVAELKQASGDADRVREQAALVARQNELLAIWSQAVDDRLKVGCPPLR